LEGAALEILKIKGSGQTLRIDQLPHTLRMIYFEDLALDLKSSPMPNLTELTMINCQIKIFPFNQSDLISLRRLVLDHNLLTEISSDIICSTNLNHFSIDNNPLSEKFKDWLEKKFPHRF
jgi:Leucine-rich repeat (LRR) protein